MITFTSTAEGISARVGATDRLMLKRVRELLESVGAEADDPAAQRLQPTLYGHEESADANIEDMMRTELVEGRRADITIFDDALAGSGSLTLSDEEADAFLRVLGDARLTVAARLGVEDNSWEGDLSGGLQMAFLHYLTYAQASLTEALLADLGD